MQPTTHSTQHCSGATCSLQRTIFNMRRCNMQHTTYNVQPSTYDAHHPAPTLPRIIRAGQGAAHRHAVRTARVSRAPEMECVRSDSPSVAPCRVCQNVARCAATPPGLRTPWWLVRRPGLEDCKAQVRTHILAALAARGGRRLGSQDRRRGLSQDSRRQAGRRRCVRARTAAPTTLQCLEGRGRSGAGRGGAGWVG